jgi:hypothetical protein
MTFEISWNETYKTPEDVHSNFDLCEAEGARSFIQSVAGTASNVILEYLKNGAKIELVGNRFKVTKIV